VRVPLSSPGAGRLEVRVLDSRGRTLSRAALRYGKAGRKTLTLRLPKRASSVRVRWVPAEGAAEQATRKLSRRRAA
jgi:hypothetical protein